MGPGFPIGAEAEMALGASVLHRRDSVVVLFFPAVHPGAMRTAAFRHLRGFSVFGHRDMHLAQLLFLRSRRVTYPADSYVGFSKSPQAAKRKGKQKIHLMEKKRRLVRRPATASRGDGS